MSCLQRLTFLVLLFCIYCSSISTRSLKMVPLDRKAQYAKKNPYIDRRESKNREIKQALVHKARLRKNYIKELKRSGEEVPEKEVRTETPVREDRNSEQLTFKERSQIVKKRREEARREKEQRLAESKLIAEKKREERLKKKEKLSKKTRSGQPKMAPRIEQLLDKIKKDYV